MHKRPLVANVCVRWWRAFLETVCILSFCPLLSTLAQSRQCRLLARVDKAPLRFSVAIVHHCRMPDSVSLHADCGDLDFVDEKANFNDATLLPGLPLLGAAIQQLFGLKEPKHVEHFCRGWRSDILSCNRN